MMRPPRHRWALAPLTILLLAASPAAAGPSNDDCLACHGENVDAAAFGDSVHGFLSCTDCHASLAEVELPHDVPVAKVDCATCHGDAVESYGKGVHARAREAGKGDAAACIDCHGKHDIRSKDDPASRTYVLNIPKTCGACHGDRASSLGIREGDVYDAYVVSVHGRGLIQSGLAVSAECTDCHGAHDIRPKDDPESLVNKMRVPDTCGKCHQGIEPIYAKSIHGQQLAAGNLRAPACYDCHTAHSISQTQTVQWKLDVLEECGTCHEQSLTTYRDTFHGQVSKLGFTRVATCAACHGSHDIRPKADPASRVSGARRQETCNQCHPGTNANFAQYDPHADKHDAERNPFLHYTYRFMQILLLVTFGFYAMHTALWFGREVAAKAVPSKRKEKEGDDDRA